MYRRVNNSRYVVFGISGIVIVMSIFTWLIYGIAKDIGDMAVNMQHISSDIHDMTESQIAMSNAVTNIDGQIQYMSHNVAIMTGNTSRMSYDVNRFASPMSYFWNMQ